MKEITLGILLSATVTIGGPLLYFGWYMDWWLFAGLYAVFGFIGWYVAYYFDISMNGASSRGKHTYLWVFWYFGRDLLWHIPGGLERRATYIKKGAEAWEGKNSYLDSDYSGMDVLDSPVAARQVAKDMLVGTSGFWFGYVLAGGLLLAIPAFVVCCLLVIAMLLLVIFYIPFEFLKYRTLPSWVRQAKDLAKNDIHTSLDMIYDEIDDICHAGKFDEIDRILRRINPEYFETDLLLGFLTATLPAKRNLTSYDSFLKKCSWVIWNIRGNDPKVLEGFARY